MYELKTRARPTAWLMAAGLCTGSVAASAATGDDGRWHFHAVPYLWLPAVDASSDVTIPSLRGVRGSELGPVSLSADVTPDNDLSSLDMAVMFMIEARKGPWSLYTDVVYTSFGSQDTKVRNVTGPAGFARTQIDRDAKTELSATVWTLAGGYRAIDRDDIELDLMAGARYLSMNSDLTLYGPGLGVGFRW
jgi:hypothetical protein